MASPSKARVEDSRHVAYDVAAHWLDQKLWSNTPTASVAFRESMLQNNSLVNTITALQLTIAAAALLLKPGDFVDQELGTYWKLTEHEQAAVEWLYVLAMFFSFLSSLLSLLLFTEKTQDLLVVHPSMLASYIEKHPFGRRGPRLLSGYMWYKLGTCSLLVGVTLGVYLVHGRSFFIACLGLVALVALPTLFKMKRAGDAAYKIACSPPEGFVPSQR